MFGETTIFDVMIWSHPIETTKKNGCLEYQVHKKETQSGPSK